MLKCPKCDAPENALRWQSWQGDTFRCTLCNHVFTTKTNAKERILSKIKSYSKVNRNRIEEMEPLIDIFEGSDSVKIYVETINANKNEPKLELKRGQLEVEVANFRKSIDLPSCRMDFKKVRHNHKNRVLEVIIPKKGLIQVFPFVEVRHETKKGLADA